ncbi:MAG: nonstructural protein [Microviridae sp.]|nr:MAG: nonstructural protein [Microviridae sp.]
MKLFTIYDSISQEYSPAMCSINVEGMEQFLNTLVNSHSHLPQHKSSSDYALFEIGTFDTDTGMAVVYPDKKFLLSLGGLKKYCDYCTNEEAKCTVLKSNKDTV